MNLSIRKNIIDLFLVFGLVLWIYKINLLLFSHLLTVLRPFWYDYYYTKVYPRFDSDTMGCWYGHEWCEFSSYFSTALFLVALILGLLILYFVVYRRIGRRIYLEIFFAGLFVFIVNYILEFFYYDCMGEYMAPWDNCSGRQSLVADWAWYNRDWLVLLISFVLFLVLIFRLKHILKMSSKSVISNATLPSN